MSTAELLTQQEAPQKKSKLHAAIVSGRIQLRGYLDDKTADFLRDLGCKWSKQGLYWWVRPTLATCWQLVFHAPAIVEADTEVQRQAHKFFGQIHRSQSSEGQPPIRKNDSWRHQLEAYWFAWHREAALLAMWMGTGKSKVAVDLIRNREAKRVLIVCPVSVRGVWRRELLKHGDLEAIVLEKGTAAKKVKQAIEYENLCIAHGKPFIVVVNYETAKSDEFSIWSLKQRWSAVIGDESHRFKAANSQVSKYMGELSMEADFRLCLTGTPMPHSPLDLFGQFRFLDPGVYGSSWHRFRATYAVSGPFGVDHIVGYINKDQLAERMRMLTFQVDQSVLDLPPVTQEQRLVTLESKSLKVYEEMKEDMIAFLDDGGEVTAPNGLVKLLRLAQVSGGFVKGDDEQIRELGTEKKQSLNDLLEDLNEPVVVFCRFMHDLDVIRSVTESLTKGFDSRGKAIKRVYGEVSGRQKDLTPHSTMPDHIDVMGVQIQAGGVGIDLTRARVGVYFSVGYSLGEFDQSVARLHRPGQTRPVVFYHLVATKTVDEVIYRSLESKREIVAEVIQYLRGKDL